MNLTGSGIALLVATLFSGTASADPDNHAHHHHHSGSFSAGEPGNPRNPARIVQVTMGEADGKMLFVPARLEVRKGEQIKFMLRNNGELHHEFILASTADNLKHADEMKRHPDMVHSEANGSQLAAKQTSELVWKFTKSGEFEYACLIPGHREAGMIGTIVVK